MSASSLAAEALEGLHFLAGVPRVLRHPLPPPRARAIVRDRLETREAAFLSLTRQAIYGHPGSPYHQLLEIAGCEWGDLDQLVGQNGLEGALAILYRRGVYLTADELKGREPVVRGSSTLSVAPSQLRNPLAIRSTVMGKLAASQTEAPVPIDLDGEWDKAVDRCLSLDARGGLGWTSALWQVPGSTTTAMLLSYTIAGLRPIRWFSQIDPAAPGLHARYAWSGRLLRWTSLVAGTPLPAPEYCPSEDPLPVVKWMHHVLERGQVPHVHTFASAGARLAGAALASGIDIEGAQLTLGGEPTTPARLAIIQQAGARGVSDYGATETGIIARGCLAPMAPDDLHVLRDLNAVIQPGSQPGPGELPPTALLYTSLISSARFVLVNFSAGDHAVLEERSCGCPMEAVGWHTHMHTVRSFEKLTAGGVAFLDTDIIRVLEETLPTRFGGGPTDYQLVEGETLDGNPRLSLLVSPAVGDLDEHALIDTFLRAVGLGSGSERMMELMWRDAGILGLERRPPIVSEGGKTFHVHRVRDASSD